jgi:hypothetical protein
MVSSTSLLLALKRITLLPFQHKLTTESFIEQIFGETLKILHQAKHL